MSISSKIKNERNNMMVVLNNNLKNVIVYENNDLLAGHDVHFGIDLSLKSESHNTAIEMLKETCDIICKEGYEIKTLNSKEEDFKCVLCLEYGFDENVSNFFYVDTKINGIDVSIAFYEKFGNVFGYVAFYTGHTVNTTVYEDGINEGTVAYVHGRSKRFGRSEVFGFKVVYREKNMVRYCKVLEDGSFESNICYKARVTKNFYRYGFNTVLGYATNDLSGF